MDEVDRIVTAWSREIPELDVSPLSIWSRVSRLARHLNLTRRDAFAGHGLDVWEFDVLAALRREGEPYELSPGQLIAQTLSTSGTMTNRIDRLEQRGFVTRLPDPNDRRGVRVHLLPPGKTAVEAALRSLLEAEVAILNGFTPEESDQAVDLLRRLLMPYEAAE